MARTSKGSCVSVRRTGRSAWLPALIVGALFPAACATMISGRSQQIPISVSPAGATVCVDGQRVGVSPMVASLSRKESHVIVIEHDGYQPVVRALAKDVNPWVVVNFVP